MQTTEYTKENLKKGDLIPPKDYKGAVRKAVKTIKEMEKDRESATKNASAAAK